MFGWGKRVVEVKLSEEDYKKLEESVCKHVWDKFHANGRQFISEWTLLDLLRKTLPNEHEFMRAIVDGINALQLNRKGGVDGPRT